MTQEQQTLASTELSPRDQDLIRTLRTICKLDAQDTFTSDTFRMYGLDRFIVDKQHGIGCFFRKLVVNGLVVQAGWTRSLLVSNHGRLIQKWKWKEG